MKKSIVSLSLLSLVLLYGCSGDDATTSTAQQAQPAAAQPQVSQAETMEQIWASDMDTAEKARRVQQLLQASNR